MEDMMVGSCLEKVFQLAPPHRTRDLTLVGESIDDQGRERFHPLSFRVHFNGPANKTKREWIHYRPFHHNLFVRIFPHRPSEFSFSFEQGDDALSDTTISFHYTTFADMLQIDSLLYDIRQFDKQVCRHPPT